MAAPQGRACIPGPRARRGRCAGWHEISENVHHQGLDARLVGVSLVYYIAGNKSSRWIFCYQEFPRPTCALAAPAGAGAWRRVAGGPASWRCAPPNASHKVPHRNFASPFNRWNMPDHSLGNKAAHAMHSLTFFLYSTDYNLPRAFRVNIPGKMK